MMSVTTRSENEGKVRIQNKYLVPIYVFQEMKLHGLLISKTEVKCSVSNFHIHASVSDLHIQYIPSVFYCSQIGIYKSLTYT
jgi:hypothetical protein